MKIRRPASSILFFCLVLSGCDTLGMRDMLRDDQVPDAVKNEPLVIDVPPKMPDDNTWPSVASVPFMPKDFSTKPVYGHYMNELEYDRDQSEAAKQQALENDPTLSMHDAPSTSGLSSSAPVLTAPQLPGK